MYVWLGGLYMQRTGREIRRAVRTAEANHQDRAAAASDAYGLHELEAHLAQT